MSEVRNLDDVLTSEMTQQEWLRFQELWVEQYTKDLILECGTDPADAIALAPLHWERYCEQEGWTGRDERLAHKREGYRLWGEP